MFYLEDRSVKEIAEMLKISVNTVKSQKQRAIELLKKNKDFIGVMLFVICD